MLTLLFRYLSVPDAFFWNQHVAPFTILFVVWVLVFFIAGLYENIPVFSKVDFQPLCLMRR